MSEISIVVTSPDEGADERSVDTGTKAWQLFADDPSVIAARVGGQLRDLAHELSDGDAVEPVAIDSPDGLDILRHSTAHVMAQAVQELFPEAKLGIGPPITDGFYYDFDVPEPFTPDDLEAIETRMRKIVKEGQKFDRREISDDDAREELADEPYKLELIGLKSTADDAAEGASVEVGEGGLTIYDNLKRDGSLAWKDLCRGPHLPTTKRIPTFRLMRSAAAYWRGDEKNKQLQRIYGTAWPSKEGLGCLPAPDRGGAATRPPPPRPGARPVQLPRRDRLRAAGLPPQGRRDQAGDGGLRPTPAHRGGLRVRRHPAHRQGGALPHVRAPALLRRGDVPAPRRRRHGLSPQGDELPDAQPDLPVAPAVVPGAAAAAVRVRSRLPA